MTFVETEALTHPQDWDTYYMHFDEHYFERKIPNFMISILKETVWCYKPGKYFELGCGSSLYLTQSALLGWEVSGIDFNYKAIEILNNYLKDKHVNIGQLIFGDVLKYECSELANKYDYLVSFGLMEHFNNPDIILQKWCAILKPGGRVLTVIPNLFSINVKLLKKYNFQLWQKHMLITPLQLDKMHLNAGLKIIKHATYKGGYELDMLLPWHNIMDKYPLFIVKLIKYCGILIAYFLKIIFRNNHRLINPIIFGVYEKP